MKRFMMLALASILGVALSLPAGAQNTTGNAPQKQTTPSTTTPKKETKEERKARKEAEKAKKKADKDSKKGTTNTNKNTNTKTQ
jgi:hypothetical protein